MFKALKTGEWYTKTITDSVASAVSVAKAGGFGRAAKLIDRQTGKVIFEKATEITYEEALTML